MTVKTLKDALAAHKVKLTETQLADLDKRQWLEDMRAAMNREQSADMHKAITAAMVGMKEAVTEAISKASDLQAETLVSLVDAIGSLGAKIDAIEIPVSDLSPVLAKLSEAPDFSVLVGEIRSLKASLQPKKKEIDRHWAFEVHRDKDGNIAQIYADAN